MKKFILSAAFLAFAGAATVSAKDVNVSTAIVAQQDSSKKEPVKLEELPEPVKATLQKDPYKAWTPSAAFLVTEANNVSYYWIDVKKEQETASLKVDKDGKVIQ
ncbi:hypothetical protein [Pedobacter sp. SYP-B3415]|uniref:hypothetical protein n=1 Tax=Pedobacter sp. SYP-B3415 TaxID=2496641 RepID=UPI00101D7C2E|nr:hypothetical protein [Pedobacter sp. SYP-B3415]